MSKRLSVSWIITMLTVFALAGCQSTGGVDDGPSAVSTSPEGSTDEAAESQPAPKAGQPLVAPAPEGRLEATFAGGCFWCMEGPFEKLDGVDEVYSGYTGGPEKNPTYGQVSSGKTGHTEAVRVIYDPAKVDYKVLVETFWRSMDPTDAGGQFADRGPHYRPAIFFHSEEQKEVALASKAALEASGKFDKPIVVPVQPAEDFWVAEDYHQDYYKTNEGHYKRYRRGSGREGFLKEVWGDE